MHPHSNLFPQFHPTQLVSSPIRSINPLYRSREMLEVSPEQAKFQAMLQGKITQAHPISTQGVHMQSPGGVSVQPGAVNLSQQGVPLGVSSLQQQPPQVLNQQSMSLQTQQYLQKQQQLQQQQLSQSKFI